jgi:hypothetical protein
VAGFIPMWCVVFKPPHIRRVTMSSTFGSVVTVLKKYTLSDASRALCWGFGATKLDAPVCGTHLQQAGLSGHASVCWSVFWQLDRGRLESQQRRKAHEGTPSSQRLAISLLMLSHAQS